MSGSQLANFLNALEEALSKFTIHTRVLNNEDSKGHISPGSPWRSITLGCSKKSVQQGRLLPGTSRRATPLFCARSVLVLRERSRREERQACEPEGPANGENAAGGFFQRPRMGSLTPRSTIDSLRESRRRFADPSFLYSLVPVVAVTFLTSTV